MFWYERDLAIQLVSTQIKVNQVVCSYRRYIWQYRLLRGWYHPMQGIGRYRAMIQALYQDFFYFFSFFKIQYVLVDRVLDSNMVLVQTLIDQYR